MLFKLSLKNIKKSFKDYAIYFFTLVLGVAIFYVFNAIDSQTVLLNVTENTAEIIELMTNMLSGVSVFVSLILGFLIIYASRFLIKRRNKEFGIYLTLGMSKRKISMLLFFETLLIGIISLIIGLGVGVVLSQAMSLLVANMFEADMKKFAFVFSKAACVKTLIYFGIMYLLVMIFNTFNIGKCKLIDLLHANKKSEKVKLKNPIFCTIVFLISSAVLGYAYYLVTGGIELLDSADKIFIPIGLGIVTTFLIFWSLSGLLLKIFMSMKKTYYRGLNSFTLRQISSKINTTVFSMAVICLMLFVTICVLSSALSLKNSMTANIKNLAPVDIQLTKIRNISDRDLEQEYSKEQIEDSKDDLETSLKKVGVNVNDYFKEYTSFNVYQSEDLTLKDTLGDSLAEVQKQFRFLSSESTEDIVKISDYNKLAKMYGMKEYTLKDDEYIIIADFESMAKVRDIALKNREEITIFGNKLKPKYDSCQDGFIEISGNHINAGVILVPDHVVQEASLSFTSMVANYKASSKEEKIKIEDNLLNIGEKPEASNIIIPSYNTKLNIVEASVGLGALVTFIGLYLGIIFLISSAAILALKELSESADNKERFRMIRRLGADEKMIHQALFRQIGIFFLFPLLIAIIHSIFGIKFCTFILETFGKDKLLPSILMTAVFLIIIYGGYFLLTYFCSKNIIDER